MVGPGESTPFRKTSLLGSYFALLFLELLSSQVSCTPDARFVVTDTVVAPDVWPFGTNWAEPNLNQYAKDTGMEPTVLRMRLIASGGTSNTILFETGPTTSAWDTVTDGFLEGATVRVYRTVNDILQLVRVDTCTKYNASPQNGHSVVLGSDGAVVQSGDAVVLYLLAVNAPIDKTAPRMTWLKKWDTWQASTGSYNFRDSTTTPPVNGGLSSLCLVGTAENTYVEVSQYRFGSPQVYMEALIPGEVYVFDLWLKQSGISSGQVIIGMSDDYKAVRYTFTGVSSDWAYHSYEFVGPAYPSPNKPVCRIFVGFVGKGQLWIDNLRVYRKAVPPFAVSPEYVQAITDFQPGCVRIWSGHTNTQWGLTLDNWLRSEQETNLLWNTNNGRVDEGHLKLPTILPILAQVKSIPWLILSPSFYEQEWLDFIEYIVGPTTTKYGALRASQGQSEPWTNVFDKIIIERGNEQWNSMFWPWNTGSGKEAGIYSEYFVNIVKTSPYWDLVKDKLIFMANGWIISADVNGFGASNARYNPSASMVDVTAYTGGWELGGTLGGNEVNENGFINTLMYLPMAQKGYVDAQVKTRDILKSQGIQYQLAIYESGPSYGLPSPSMPFNVAQEVYGKSLANALSTLDCLLYSSLQNFGPQNFFLFQATANWASHSPYGFYPHTAWLVLQMRNRYASGQMVNVINSLSPAMDVVSSSGAISKNVPLVASYAFRNKNGDYSIFFLSRRLNDSSVVHSELPFLQAQSAMLYKMEGNPRDSNTYSYKIRIQQQTWNTTSSNLTFILPPSAIYLFVFKGGTPKPLGVLTATVSRAAGQPENTTDTYASFLVYFDRPTQGLSSDNISVKGPGAKYTTVVVTEMKPSQGTTFSVLVRGFPKEGRFQIGVKIRSVRGMDSTWLRNVTLVDSGVEFHFPPVQDCVALYDGFNILPGQGPYAPSLHHVATGFGWKSYWYTQSIKTPYVGPNYELIAFTPMQYLSYGSNGSFLVGGLAYQTVNRFIDVMGSMSRWYDLWNSPARVGLPGTSLWVSALMRRDSTVWNTSMFMMSTDWAWVMSALRIGFGYFEQKSNFNGVRYWSVAIRPSASSDLIVARSDVPITVGVEALLVVNIQFGVQPQVSLYVNPKQLGVSTPPRPSAKIVAPFGTDLRFSTAGFYAGNSYYMASIDEIRFGDSYKAVTSTPFKRCS